MMRSMFTRTLIGLGAVTMLLGAVPANAQTTLQAGDLIKTSAAPSVYYFGADGKRYVFANSKTYFTWYAGFTGVKTITIDQMGGIMIGGNVTYKPGVKMVKIDTDPKVYAVSKNGILRPIGSEAVAAALYGANWNKMIDDVPDAFFVNYHVGAAVNVAADYDKAVFAAAVPSINVDKLLVNPPAGFVDFRQTSGFVPSAMTVNAGTKVTWIIMDNSLPFVASDPHPTHTDLPGLSSGTLGMGATYGFVFSQVGTWGYHDHNAPTFTGSITVK